MTSATRYLSLPLPHPVRLTVLGSLIIDLSCQGLAIYYAQPAGVPPVNTHFYAKWASSVLCATMNHSLNSSFDSFIENIFPKNEQIQNALANDTLADGANDPYRGTVSVCRRPMARTFSHTFVCCLHTQNRWSFSEITWFNYWDWWSRVCLSIAPKCWRPNAVYILDIYLFFLRNAWRMDWNVIVFGKSISRMRV